MAGCASKVDQCTGDFHESDRHFRRIQKGNAPPSLELAGSFSRQEVGFPCFIGGSQRRGWFPIGAWDKKNARSGTRSAGRTPSCHLLFLELQSTCWFDLQSESLKKKKKKKKKNSGLWFCSTPSRVPCPSSDCFLFDPISAPQKGGSSRLPGPVPCPCSTLPHLSNADPMRIRSGCGHGDMWRSCFFQVHGLSSK